MPKRVGTVIKLSNGKEFKVRPIDASRLYVDIKDTAYINPIYKNGVIDSVSLEDKFIIYLNDYYTTRLGKVENSIYKIRHIAISADKKGIILNSTIPNKTTTFILPTLNKSKKWLRYTIYFINSFLDEDLKHIVLLYRFTGSDVYLRFENYLLQDKLYVDHFEPNNYMVAYRFRIPEEFHNDVKLFTEGKYSQFSSDMRRAVKTFHYDSVNSMPYLIITRSDKLRKQLENQLKVKISKRSELASKPNMNYEYFSKDIL